MTSPGLEILGFEPDALRRRIDFLTTYAQRYTDRAQNSHEASGAFLEVNDPSPESEADWGDAAGSLVEAAQLLSLTDVRSAQEFYDQAADCYTRIGHPYSLFLRAIAREQLPLDEYEQGHTWFETAQQATGDTELSALPRAWQVPQQQAYFLLAASLAMPHAGDGRLVELAGNSPNRRSTAPFGALGTAVARVWGVAMTLLTSDRSDSKRAADEIGRQLAGMSLNFAQRIERAQANDYLWSAVAAPIDIGDTEIIGITTIASRVLPRQALMVSLERITSELPPLARIPLQVGLALTDQEVEIEPPHVQQDAPWSSPEPPSELS